jgi:hypothetical protein
MHSIRKRTFLGSAVLLVAIYAGDDLYVRLKMAAPKADDPFETVTYPRVLAIPRKDGKTDYEIDALQPEQTEVCVHSLFPHAGHNPCWFVKRHAQRIVPMTMTPFSL